MKFNHMTALALATALLSACGGDSETTTLVHQMTLHDEANSLLEMQRDLSARGIAPIKIECGLLDPAKLPFDQQFIFADGYTPRLTYFTFSRSDAEAVKDLPWRATADESWRNTYADPFDCGPLPT